MEYIENKNNVNIGGAYTIEVYDVDGNLKQTIVPNTITKTGMAEVANLIIGSGTAFKYIAIGSGTTAPTADDTQLEGEIERETASCSRVTTDYTNDTAQLEATFTCPSGQTWAVTEAGVFNDASSGTMLSSTTFSVVNLSANDSIKIIYKIQVSS